MNEKQLINKYLNKLYLLYPNIDKEEIQAAFTAILKHGPIWKFYTPYETGRKYWQNEYVSYLEGKVIINKKFVIADIIEWLSVNLVRIEKENIPFSYLIVNGRSRLIDKYRKKYLVHQGTQGGTRPKYRLKDEIVDRYVGNKTDEYVYLPNKKDYVLNRYNPSKKLRELSNQLDLEKTEKEFLYRLELTDFNYRLLTDVFKKANGKSIYTRRIRDKIRKAIKDKYLNANIPFDKYSK